MAAPTWSVTVIGRRTEALTSAMFHYVPKAEEGPESMGFWNRRAATVVAVAALAIATGCASAPQSQGKPTSVQSRTDPAEVAVHYTSALYAGNTQAAASYLRKADQPLFKDVTKGMRPHSTRAENLRAGRSTVHGVHANVVLTGTLCALAPSSSDPASPVERCVSNTDPASSNPIFTVPLIADGGGSWYISYSTPPSPTTSDAASGTVTPGG